MSGFLSSYDDSEALKLFSNRLSHLMHLRQKPRLDADAAHSLLDDLDDIWGSGDVDSIRDILSELIVRIDALPEKGKFNIVWNF